MTIFTPMTFVLTAGWLIYLFEHKRIGLIVKSSTKTPAQRRAACEVYKRRAGQ